MIYAATEVCDTTGSWLRDFNIDELIKNLPDIRISGILSERSRLYKTLDDKFHFETNRIIIRKTSRIARSVSYTLHTNRELIMMLRGEKPFSVFQRSKNEELNVFNGQNFYHYRKLISSEKRTIGDTVYFFKFLKGEEWRVSAYCLLLKVRSYSKNSSELEIMEGELLGYSREQNMEYIEKFWSKQALPQ